MDADVLRGIRGLLSERRVLCLAAVIDGEPAASLLAFAVAPDFRGVFVQASALAKHSQALQPGARVAVLVHGNDTEDVDALQVPRLSVQAGVEVLGRDTEAFRAASRVFVERLPGAAVTLDFADFNLYRLAFVQGRYVAGFAQAYDVDRDTFGEVAALTA